MGQLWSPILMMINVRLEIDNEQCLKLKLNQITKKFQTLLHNEEITTLANFTKFRFTNILIN